MKPELRKQNKSKASFKPLRAKLNKTTLQLDKKRSTRIEQRKEFNECYTELQNDLSKVVSKLQVFHECVTSIFDRMECLEERIALLESQSSPTDGRSVNVSSSEPQLANLNQLYSDALQSDCTVRIAKLEFSNSEK